jgi:hypothetical protein
MRIPRKLAVSSGFHCALAGLCWMGVAGDVGAASVNGAATANGGPTAARSYEFQVLLDDKPIGTHSFRVREESTSTRHVSSDASFDVRVLGITLYRYRHRAEERWQDGCLQGIEASTSDNGDRLVVRGAKGTEGFRLDAPANVPVRDPCISTYAYWDPSVLLEQTELLNPQTGKYDAVRVESLGEETVQRRGSAQPARRYRLRGEELTIDLWYSPTGEWLQLASTTSSKRRLLYRLRD